MVIELVKHEITNEEFLEINQISDISNWIRQELDIACSEKSAELLDDVVFLIFQFQTFDISLAERFNELLLVDWHFKHEDIVLLLEILKSKDSLYFLHKAVYSHPYYLDEDDMHSFEKKCIRAIFQIGKENALSLLEDISKNFEGDIRAIAERQISKL